MRIQLAVLLTILGLLNPCYSFSSDFEDASTPIEQEDVKSIGQIDNGNYSEEESTPIERSDTNSIDQVDDAQFFENDSTPIEQEDSHTIEQIND